MKKLFLILFFAVSALELVFLVTKPEAHVITKPFIVLALLGYYLAGAEVRSHVFAAALLFCWVGDVLLMFRSEAFFIFGLAAFLTGHVLYIVTYLQHRVADRSKELLGPQKARLAFPLLLLGTGLVTILYPRLGGMKFPVMVYATVITVMSMTALFRFGRTNYKSFAYVMAGALLFVASDSLLAVNKFLSPFEFSGIAIMTTYCAAQYLIVEGLLRHSKK